MKTSDLYTAGCMKQLAPYKYQRQIKDLGTIKRWNSWIHHCKHTVHPQLDSLHISNATFGAIKAEISDDKRLTLWLSKSSIPEMYSTSLPECSTTHFRFLWNPVVNFFFYISQFKRLWHELWTKNLKSKSYHNKLSRNKIHCILLGLEWPKLSYCKYIDLNLTIINISYLVYNLSVGLSVSLSICLLVLV